MTKDRNYRSCVVAEITTPTLLIQSKLKILDVLTDEDPEIINMKDYDFIEKCKKQLEEKEEFHMQDIIELLQITTAAQKEMQDRKSSEDESEAK